MSGLGMISCGSLSLDGVRGDPLCMMISLSSSRYSSRLLTDCCIFIFFRHMISSCCFDSSKLDCSAPSCSLTSRALRSNCKSQMCRLFHSLAYKNQFVDQFLLTDSHFPRCRRKSNHFLSNESTYFAYSSLSSPANKPQRAPSLGTAKKLVNEWEKWQIARRSISFL